MVEHESIQYTYKQLEDPGNRMIQGASFSFFPKMSKFDYNSYTVLQMTLFIVPMKMPIVKTTM